MDSNCITEIIKTEGSAFTSHRNITGVTDDGAYIDVSALFSIRDIEDGTGGVEMNVNLHFINGDTELPKATITKLLESAFIEFKASQNIAFKALKGYKFGPWNWHKLTDSDMLLIAREL